MIRKLKAAAIAAIMVTAVAVPSTGVLAATVIATLDGGAGGGSVTRHIVSGFGSSSSGIELMAERFDLTRTGGTDATIFAGLGGITDFFAFCVEPREFIYEGASVSYTVSTLAQAALSSIGGIGATKADQIAELFGRFQPNLAATMSDIQAGALQIAVWEIVREFSYNPLNVYSGNVYYDPGSDNPNGMISLAQTYLSAINGAGPRAVGLEALTVAGGQDLLVQVVSAAPEPMTWAMMIGGFLAIGMMLRRRPETARALAA
jgi:hypothetical protein